MGFLSLVLASVLNTALVGFDLPKNINNVQYNNPITIKDLVFVDRKIIFYELSD